MTIRLVGLALLLLTSGLCHAEPVFGFVRQAMTSTSPKSYLAAAQFNMGYVTIKASVDNPANKGCISPNASNILRKIFREESEIFLAARVWGFKGVSGEKWIPIANYKWSNAGQFCNSVFQPDVVLVPLTPILASRDISKPGTMEEPYIRIALRSKTERSEKISSAFTTLLQLSTAYATGGSATTLTQLLDIAGGPAAKLISAQVNEAFSTGSDQDFSLTFKWSDLSKGKLDFPFQLSSVDKGIFETVEAALSRLHPNSADVTELIRFTVTVDTRRSVFFADSDIQSGSKVFSSKLNESTTGPYAILNFPQDSSGGLTGAISSIQQLLSSDAPGLAKQMTGGDFSLACKKLITKVFNAGFNRHDTALITAAALDESKSNWRTDADFIGACISDGDLLSDIAALRPPLLIPGEATDIEFSDGTLPFVTYRHKAFLVELRNALISRGFARTEGLRSAFQGIENTVTWAGDVPDLVTVASTDSSGADRSAIPLEKLGVAAAGCFVGYATPGAGIPHLGMALLLIDSAGARKPYMLSIRLDPAKLDNPIVGKSIVGVWLFDLDLAPTQANAIANAKYGNKAAMCSMSEPRSAQGIIEKLKGIKI